MKRLKGVNEDGCWGESVGRVMAGDGRVEAGDGTVLGVKGDSAFLK